MPDYNSIIKELKTNLFFAQAKCGHVIGLIQDAKSPEDLAKIAEQIHYLSENVKEYKQIILTNHIKDNGIEAVLWTVQSSIKESLIPGLNGLKFNRNAEQLRKFLNDWLPVAKALLETVNEARKLAKS